MKLVYWVFLKTFCHKWLVNRLSEVHRLAKVPALVVYPCHTMSVWQ